MFPWDNMLQTTPGWALGIIPAILPFVVIWSLVWKGLALWVAARRGHTIWFIIFLVVNILGILEIIYLLTTNGFEEFKNKK